MSRGSYELKALMERFDGVSQKILEHPNFDDESRDVAIEQAATYMLTLNYIFETHGGVLPESVKPAFDAAMEFCDLTDEFCSRLN